MNKINDDVNRGHLRRDRQTDGQTSKTDAYPSDWTFM